MQTIQVRTTQNVFIQYPIASVGDRIIAFIIDRFILVFYAIAVMLFFFNIKMYVIWIWVVVVGLPFLFYHLIFEIIMNGQTPGKRAMSIKVIRLDGTSASIGDYLLRWIFSFVDFYIFSGVIAVIVIIAGEKGQRVGDVVAGTSVVKLTRQKEITASEVFISPENNYSPVFPQAVHLTERDIELIQRSLEVYRDHGNMEPVTAVTERVKTILGVQTDMPPIQFLHTVVKDFQHITSR